jgi:hypothetical protein
VRKEEVLHRVKGRGGGGVYIVQTIKRRKDNWIGHILRGKCLLNQVIEGKIEGRVAVTGRQGKRRKHLPEYLKEKREYCKLKEEALDGTV